MSNRLPSATESWNLWTYAIQPCGWSPPYYMDVAALDNGEIWVTAGPVDVTAAHSNDEANHNLILKAGPEGMQRIGGDMWTYGYEEFGGGPIPVPDGSYLPHSMIYSPAGRGLQLHNDGQNLLIYEDDNGWLYHLDVSTYILTQMGQVSPASGQGPGDSPFGGAYAVGQMVHRGNHWYYCRKEASGSFWQLWRVEDEPPYGQEQLTSWKETGEVSWDDGSTTWNGHHINATTRLPNMMDGESLYGNSDAMMLGWYDGYWYATTYRERLSFAPYESELCALVRWADTLDQPIEYLYYAYTDGDLSVGGVSDEDAWNSQNLRLTVSDPVAQPIGVQSGVVYGGDFTWAAFSGPLLEGWMASGTDTRKLAIMDDNLFMNNGTTLSSFQSSHTNGMTVTKWHIPTLLSDVTTNGRPLVHDREAPWYQSISNGRSPWEGDPALGAWQDRRWPWQDGVDSIHGSASFDTSEYPDFKGKLVLGHHVTYMPNVAHWASVLPIALLEDPQISAKFQVTLSFESVRLSAYQRQVEVARVSVPEVVELT